MWKHCAECQAAISAFRIVGTDVDPEMVNRARRGCYAASSFKDLPPEWVQSDFVQFGECYRVRDDLRAGVEFRLEDIRVTQPEGPFHLVFCRNLVFTYFDPQLQARLLASIVSRLAPAGLLVIGKHESLPEGEWDMIALAPRMGVYQLIRPASR